MIEIFENCQTKFIANQTNRDDSLIIVTFSGICTVNLILYLYVSLHIGYNLFGKFSILK